MSFKVLELNVDVNAANDKKAEEIRRNMSLKKTLLVNVMASPGAGKTSTLLALSKILGKKYKIGVMEADIEAETDAETMEKNNIRTIEVHTGGECAMDADMTAKALSDFDIEGLDVIFLENIGNLVCPAENDVGADINLVILSLPEGDDKPLKYPLMFRVTDACIVNKTDTREFFPFDDKALEQRVHRLNEDSKIFFISALKGEGTDELASWLDSKIQEKKNE
jgi:hydrogenase nickel incorporation protein HypB